MPVHDDPAVVRAPWGPEVDGRRLLHEAVGFGRALRAAGFSRLRLATGFKPVARVGGRRLPLRLEVPYPPLIGNGLVAVARC